MILTEAEAKMKWCPFKRMNGNWFPDGDPPGSPGPECMGSTCMAWRFASKRNPDWKPRHGVMMAYSEEHPDDMSRTHIEDRERGYCGLAGRI